MKKILRGVAVLTLGLYVGLVVTETCHTLWGHHVEANCAICQVAHQTPVISQAKPVLHTQESFRRIAEKVAPLAFAEVETAHSGRSPPVL